MEEEKSEPVTLSGMVDLPVLPLRDVVVYPHMVIPLFVGRMKSIKALEAAMENDKHVHLVAQMSATKDDPDENDLYKKGCVATILQLLKLPDGTVKVLVEGLKRGAVRRYLPADHFLAEIEILDDTGGSGRELDALSRSLLAQFEQYVKFNKKIPPEVLTTLAGIDDVGRLVDTMAAHVTLKIEEKQELLELNNVRQRLERLMVLIESEIDLLQVEKRIRGQVKRQMEKSQREYYLSEQMKAIQRELGGEDGATEIEAYENKLKLLPKEARDKAKLEINKLKMMPPMSAEATVSRNYLDWLFAVPWPEPEDLDEEFFGEEDEDEELSAEAKEAKTKSWKAKKKKKKKPLLSKLDLIEAQKILDQDHYGLTKVKERIIEYLAVQERVHKIKGPILCLVGPPGVGKTSLGRSMARATGREFVRISLGGVRDEAEIRGHRRTYIGSMPGKIMQKLAKVKVRNPLFMLDEVDKMAMDFRGDPASALLEVLDPEQNNAFNDHYLEVDYDLSDVMFVCTANSQNIPPPLLDRMEVIRLSGYTEDEKLHIAEDHLVLKQIEQNGLKPSEIKISSSAVRDVVRYYTREAGVRNLEREISKLCRKVVTVILKKPSTKLVNITQKQLEKFLGVKRFRYGKAEEEDKIGQVTGLAWTEVGGELLTIEAAIVPGKGKTSHTGQLGDVMKESILAAVTVVRSRTEGLGIDRDFYEKNDIHIHMPEGAIPKDGPSAGIGMCTALVSALTSVPVRSDVAMTGEITLHGAVLPIGGLKEKLLAARRGGITEVIIPNENMRDLKEIPANILRDLKIHPVKWIDEVFSLALTEVPKTGIKTKSTTKKTRRSTTKAGSGKGRRGGTVGVH